MVADVTVVGSGVVALATAVELGDRGLHVRLLGTQHAGEASTASGGLLAPTIGPAGSAADILLAARDYYPGYVAALEARTGMRIPLNSRGILEIALDDPAPLQAQGGTGATWLDQQALAAEEPVLAHLAGALLHGADGAVEPLPLLDALRAAVARHDRISVVREDAVEIHVTELGCNVLSDWEMRYASDQLVLAAGAWSPLIKGVGAPATAVEPVRGQMVAFRAAPLRHVVYGPRGYLVPKSDGCTMAGSTTEHVGFDSAVTDEGVAAIVSMATEVCPTLADVGVEASWAGLRPSTPDGLPLLGPDPERPRLVYACGHSRNGMLLAPLGAAIVADIVRGSRSRYDLTPLQPGRFSR